MSASLKYLVDHGPVLKGLGKTVIAAVQQRFDRGRSVAPVTPGPELRVTLPPRRAELVTDYIRHVGGDPSAYKGQLPPHFFPQWSFGLASETLVGVPYPLAKVMNGGCRLEINGPMPSDEPIECRVALESIDDDGRRAVLCQRIVTGTASAPEAIVARLYAIVPLGKSGEKKPKTAGSAGKDRPRVPAQAKEVARWRLKGNAGLEFAKLTGDFNPVHWIPAYARAFGFRNTILHGFSTMARAYEGVLRGLYVGTRTMERFDVKFTRPMVLPARVGLYVDGENVFVGDAPGGPAYMVGTFATRPR